jgi:hypothetical protein
MMVLLRTLAKHERGYSIDLERLAVIVMVASWVTT